MAQRQGVDYSCVAVAAFCMTWVVPAAAQSLSHDEAVQTAIERAPMLEAQRAAVESAQAQAVSAGRLPDPQLVVGIDNLPVAGADAYSLDRDFMTMRKAGVMQVFPNSHKRASQREHAAALVALSESQSRHLQLEVARSASQAWIAVLSAQQLADALAKLKPEMELQIQNARSALASGRGATLTALTVQAALLDLDDQLIQAQRDLLNARLELQRWVGDTAGRPLGQEPNFRELPVAREKILASVHRHSELIVVDRQVALARSEVELARADKRADWSAELVYSDRGAAFADMVSLEFRVGLPLFTRYRQNPMIAAKRADLSQREAEREEELRMHAVEVGRALTTWEAARERIELYEHERLPLARDHSKAAIAGYQSGTQALDDVLASRIAEIEAHRDHAALTNELGQAWAFLRYLEPEVIAP